MLPRLLANWVDFARRNAALIAIAAVLSAGACGWYTATRIKINTDTANMLSAELPFRQNTARLQQAFPQMRDPLLILVEGDNPDVLHAGADRLVASLRERPDLFSDIFDPAGDPFFRRNGLLFLDEDALYDLSDRLAEAQPFLGTLWRTPTLPGLLDLLGLAIDQTTQDGGAPIDIAVALDAVAEVAVAQAAGQPKTLSWRNLMTGDQDPDTPERRFIVVQPVLDYTSLAPAAAVMDEARRLAAEYGVDVRLSGAAALDHEELESVQDGLGLAGALTVILVLGLLTAGLRSGRLVTATLITLFVGLLWTAAFATLAVGRLNLISVAFAILFIGLSVDFGIHFALRQKEEINRGKSHADALRMAAKGVGGALILSAVAAAIGFFSFLPTAYIGLAELGLISGVSMFIALFANLTLLPALLTLMPPRPTAEVGSPSAQSTEHPLQRHHWAAVVVAVGLGASAAWASTGARFDFDPLNLKDPDSESMQVLHDISGDPQTSPYMVEILADDLDAADRFAAQARDLPSVHGAATLSDFVPANQDEKLDVISSTALFLEPAFAGAPSAETSEPTERARAVADLGQKLTALIDFETAPAPTRAAAGRLRAALGAVDRDIPGPLAELERRLMVSFAREIGLLRIAMTAEPVSLEDLTGDVRARYLATDERARVEIFPKGDMNTEAALRQLVDEVRGIAPQAVGAPVVIVEAGEAVVTSFIQAASLSVALISVLIAILLRRLRSVILVFAPLTLAALLTIAASVLLDLPFNFANVIVLPLLFGLGVASGIHLVIREGQTGTTDKVLSSSTPRAVLFSALTTIGSFGSMALSGHPGTASMGVLLTLAIALTLGCTLVVLPALMAIWPTTTKPAP
jgi:uncharacterized protein